MTRCGLNGDSLVRGLVLNGTARLLWVDATDTVATMLRLHGIQDGARVIARELAIASLLMSAWTKGDERIMLQLQGEKPACSFSGESDAEGHFRGWIRPAKLPASSAEAVTGMLMASKSTSKGEMYRGVTEVPGGSLTEALQAHLGQSDQVDVVLRIGEVDGRVIGMLVERLPGPDKGFAVVVEVLQAAGLAQLSEEFAEGTLMGQPIQVLDTRELKWQCRCGVERVESMLTSLGATELDDMAETDGGAEIRCHFCNTLYQFDAAQLGALAAGLREN